MAESKLTRKLLKQFASSAPSTEIDVFGSLAASALATSTDPDVIQSLSAWLGGWADEVLANDSPVLEDRNAVDFVYSYMMKTIFQMGIPEWLATETYFVGSIVNASGVLYKSVVNSNIGNSVTDPTKWQPYSTGGLNPQANSLLAARCLGTWTSGAWGDAAFAGRGLAYSPSLDVLIAVGIADPGSTTHSIMKSTDRGATWTAVVAPSTKFVGDVCWAEELGIFIAVCQSGAGGTGKIYTSPDGDTWTAHDAPVTCQLNAVIWVPELGLAVAVGGDGTSASVVITSTDGSTWVSRTVTGGGNPSGFTSVAYSPERQILVACGVDITNTPYISTSPDGVTAWTPRTAVVGSEGGTVVWSKELARFIMVGALTFVLPAVPAQTSYDGITWNALTIPNLGASIVPIALEWAPELGELIIGYAAFAGTTNNIVTTRDLTNFSTKTVATTNSATRLRWVRELARVFDPSGTVPLKSKFVQHFIVPNVLP